MASFAYDDASAQRLFDELGDLAGVRFDFRAADAARASASELLSGRLVKFDRIPVVILDLDLLAT
jgi:hypothetical protein